MPFLSVLDHLKQLYFSPLKIGILIFFWTKIEKIPLKYSIFPKNFKNPKILGILGFSQRSEKSRHRGLKFPRFGKNPRIWQHWAEISKFCRLCSKSYPQRILLHKLLPVINRILNWKGFDTASFRESIRTKYKGYYGR